MGFCFFFSSRRRHTRLTCDWSSDVCSSDLRLSHRAGTKWFGSFSYTYSRLTGNYPGLTNSDPTDGNGGRHNPNNTRLFDLPNMTYLPNGKIDDGPLSSDRPNTAKAYGYYRLKWFGMETNFGVVQ